jgi:hypothetical protein
MKSIYLFLLLLNHLSCKAEPSNPQISIQGIYEVSKILYAKTEIPIAAYQPMIVISMDSDSKGILTFNTNKVMLKASDTQSVNCEFTRNGNAINIYDLDNQVFIGTIEGGNLHLVNTKKNFESEMFATKSSSLE